jgi:hypothetical protein
MSLGFECSGSGGIVWSKCVFERERASERAREREREREKFNIAFLTCALIKPNHRRDLARGRGVNDMRWWSVCMCVCVCVCVCVYVCVCVCGPCVCVCVCGRGGMSSSSLPPGSAVH